MKRLAFFICIMLFLNTSMVRGQQNDADPGAPIAPTVRETAAPYDEKLMRLAEVLGSVHYLRALCKSGEGTKWRDTMAALLEAEKPTPKRKARLIARFNRGYRAFDQTYNTCTRSAILAANRYTKEGAELSVQITTRYGR